MTELDLGEIPSFKFGKKLIIQLDERWCKIFEDTNPKFHAKINKKGNYVLVGPNLKCKPTRRDLMKEISNNV